jgi:hypothetical protein
LTDGTDKADQIYKKYRSLGYDIITISDYQSINTYCSENRTHIPVYEHGYNITKNHHVCIGATRVTWTDYIVGSNRFHKQHILGLLSKNNAFIAIAHPVLLNAFKSSDMTRLSGYDAIEVYNHYRDSSRLWDAALSAGKCVWAIGNDDSHDIHDERQTGVCWTMVNAGSADRDSILTALKNGRMIAVKGRNAIVENALQAVKITNKILSVEVLNPARTISFIGQQGKINHNVKNSHHAKYMLNSHDTYIRIEINNTNSTMLLNPIYRTSENDQIQQAEINWVMTWLQRFFLLFASSLLVFSKNLTGKNL